MIDNADLWSNEINAFVDAAFESGIVSRNPSDAEQHTAYRYAIKLAMDEGRQHQTDALKLAREALQDCVDDLEAEIEAKRGTVLKRTTERDLASVKKGRAALEARGFKIVENK